MYTRENMHTHTHTHTHTHISFDFLVPAVVYAVVDGNQLGVRRSAYLSHAVAQVHCCCMLNQNTLLSLTAMPCLASFNYNHKIHAFLPFSRYELAVYSVLRSINYRPIVCDISII